MQLRSLGNTGLDVTPLGLGLAALGRPGYINLGHADDLGRERSVEAMEAHCHRVLDAAWRLGVRYFDAARSYGRAEAFLGHWLSARAVRPTVGSKWGYTYTADWRVQAEVHEVKDHSLPVLERQWAETRAELGAPPSLYQIHSATLESGVLTNASVLTRLAGLKDGGVRIGLTTSGPDQAVVIQRALAIEIDGRPLFDAVQSTWNLLEPSAGPALAAARAAGVGVIVKEGLANGRLTGRNRAPEFAARRALLEGHAAAHAATVDALALAAVLAQPWADVVLSGAASVEHLESNACATGLDLSGEVETLCAALAEPAALYWHTRAGLAWN